MKIMLLEDVQGTGKKGEIAEVSEGYARNFLLPKKKAIQASAQVLNDVKNKEEAKARKADLDRQAAIDTADKIKGKTVKIAAKAGSNGKLFGAVTSKEVAAAAEQQLGFALDKKKISVDDIKTFGTFTAHVKLHAGVASEFFVLVVDGD